MISEMHILSLSMYASEKKTVVKMAFGFFPSCDAFFGVLGKKLLDELCCHVIAIVLFILV